MLMPRDGTYRIRTQEPARRSHPKILEAQAEDGFAPDVHSILISPLADDEGRFRASAAVVKAVGYAVDPNITIERIDRVLHLLERVRLIHLYESDGASYGKLHDWHEWQKVDNPTASMMPPPPHDLCRCCAICWDNSPKTRRLLVSTHEDSTSTRAGGEGRGSDVKRGKNNSSALTDEQKSAQGAALAHSRKRLIAYTKAAAPEYNAGQAGKFFKARLLKDDTGADLMAAVDYFFDEYVRDKSACNFSHFQKCYNHILSVLIERQQS